MAFDGLITKSVVYELNTCLIGGKIDRIFCPNSNEVLLGVYSCLLYTSDAADD